MSRHFRLPKDRIAALAADWGLLLLLSYCTYFLINHWYRATHRVSPVYKVPFPEYAYALAIIATLVLVLVWENLGTSIGWKGVGLTHSDLTYRPLGPWQRAKRIPADLVSWALTLVGAGFAVLPLVGLATLLYGVASRTGLTIVPTITFWPLGTWYVTLGLALGLVLMLVAASVASWWTARRLWSWLWPARKGDRPWVDRVAGAVVCRLTDLEHQRPPRRWWQTSWGLASILLVAVTIYVGALTTEVNLGTLIRRASSTGYFWNRLVTPDFGYFLIPDPDLGDTLLNAIIQTISLVKMN